MTVQSLIARASSGAMAIALVSLSAPAAASPPVNGWGVALTDVTPDPAVRYGTLPNGMKYAIMHNATPKGAASVRLQIAFGSIAESENERGLAHFIEHMAFSGSTHVPEDEMMKMLERQGLSFGADTNAFTGFDTTTYVLDLPAADAQHVDTALFLLRETGSELKFDPAAVDRQRAVILSEVRARDNFQRRLIMHRLAFDFPQTPYRDGLGLESTIRTTPVETLRSLYRRYYRPEYATLVFVGDADPAEIEAKIAKTFSDWRGVGPAGAPLPRGKVDLARPMSFATFSDPAVPTAVDYKIARAWKNPDDSLAERRRHLVEGLAVLMFDRRLQRLSNSPRSSLISGRMGLEELRDAALISSVGVEAKDGGWKEALATAEQEVRRAVQFGFTESELKTASSNMIGSLHLSLAQSDTRTNQAIATNILSTVGKHEFVTSPKTMMPIEAILLKSVSLDEVNAAFRELWTGSAPLIDVSSKDPLPKQQLAATFQASRAIALAAPKDNSAQAFAYDNFGPPGKVVSDKRVADLDMRMVRFANNVRLNIKKTDFEANRVRFLVRMGGGDLDLPRSKPGLATMISVTSTDAGLKKDSIEDLKDLMAGKVVNPGMGVSQDAFIAAGATVPQDLTLQMKLSAAYLTDPGFRPEAARKWAAVVPVVEKQVDAQPEAVAAVRLPVLLASGDERFGMPAEAVLAKRNFEEAKAALAPVIASAPIEITVVGDVDENAAIAAVADSFGALPTRKAADRRSPELLRVAFRSDRSPIILKHDGPADKALIETIWPTTDDSNEREIEGVELLKSLLEIKMTENVRQKLGDTYTPAVQNYMSHIFKGFGYLSAAAVVAPDKADEVRQAIIDAAAELRAKPVSDDLLARARNPKLQWIDHSLRDNSFWIGALSRAQSEPALLDRIRDRKALLAAFIPSDLQKLAQKYLQPDRMQQVRIVSSKARSATASR